jgi:hypothetical protein
MTVKVSAGFQLWKRLSSLSEESVSSGLATSHECYRAGLLAEVEHKYAADLDEAEDEESYSCPSQFFSKDQRENQALHTTKPDQSGGGT